MKKLFFILLLIAFGVRFVNAQPTIQWQKCYGSIAYDRSYSIQQTIDKGFIIAGGATDASGDVSIINGTNGWADYWIVKTDSLGAIEWEKSFGGSEADIAYSVQQTTDGGYVVGGNSKSIDGDVTGHHGAATIADCWVIKLDALGSLQWEKSYGGNAEETANYIQQTTDGGYVIAGQSSAIGGDVTTFNGGMSDYWVIKIDNLGTIEWQKSFGGSGDEEAYSLQQTIDSGYIVAGISTSTNGDITNNKGGADYWVIKLDDFGNIQWQKSYGGSDADGANSVRQLPNGNYIIVGASNSMDGDVTGGLGVGLSSVWVVKIDSIGNIIFEKHHNNAGISNWANDVLDITTDGGYIISGTASSNSSDYWVIKADNLGSVQWEKQLWGSSTDEAYSIKQTSDGGYIVAGYTNSTDGNVTFNNGLHDYWVVKLNSVVGIKEDIYESTVSCFPNPTNTGIITILSQKKIDNVWIYNGIGKIIYDKKNSNSKRMSIDLSNMPSGMYLVMLEMDKQVITKKLIYKP